MGLRKKLRQWIFGEGVLGEGTVSRYADWVLLASSLISALGLLLVYSKSSPLYPMNDWVDVNAELSMGRAMAAGAVPYRDVYDHRGPLLHMLFALAICISSHSYFGVYILEVISMMAFLYYAGRIALLYTKNVVASVFSSLIVGLGVASSYAFCHGGSPEQLMLPFLEAPLYYVLRAVREDGFPNRKELILCGLFAGVIFWVKYTVLGLYVGLVLFMFFWTCFGKRDVRLLGRAVGYFLLGVLICTLPILLYFALHRSLGDLWQVYFYDNLFHYNSDIDGIVVWRRILGLFSVELPKGEPILFWSIILAVPWVALRSKKEESALVAVTAVFTFLTSCCLSTYHRYYRITLAAFLVFGVIAMFQVLWNVANKIGHGKMTALTALVVIPIIVRIVRRGDFSGISDGFQPAILLKAILLPIASIQLIGLLLCGLLCVLTILMNKRIRQLFAALYCVFLGMMMAAGVLLGHNAYLLRYDKSDLPQYQFAAIVEKEPGSQLLCYHMMDFGFYNALGQPPQYRYFYKPNTRDPAVTQEMDRYVAERLPDYIVSMSELTKEGYCLVDEAEFWFEYEIFNFFLYSRIG